MARSLTSKQWGHCQQKTPRPKSAPNVLTFGPVEIHEKESADSQLSEKSKP